MKIAGIIAEYSPFHNGHAYHIAETRRITGCDYVIVCMSGNFVQRGEAAFPDKWKRAETALKNGADAVFELPALYAVRTADHFARGGVFILGSLGCDALSFGSECDDAKLLQQLAKLRSEEPEAVSSAIHEKMKSGLSHPRAQGEVYGAYLGIDPETLNSPNMILAAEYIRAAGELGFPMEAVPVKRVGAYHDAVLHGEFASASAIRSAVTEGRTDEIRKYVPEESFEALIKAEGMHAPDDILLHVLRSMDEKTIALLPDVSEGLENRICECAKQAGSREELIGAVKCRRYTRARIARLCAHALLGITQKICEEHPLPEYARLIGLREDARPLMAELKKRAKLPIISSTSELAGSGIFTIECRATDIRALMCDAPEDRAAGQEFTKKFIRV